MADRSIDDHQCSSSCNSFSPHCLETSSIFMWFWNRDMAVVMAAGEHCQLPSWWEWLHWPACISTSTAPTDPFWGSWRGSLLCILFIYLLPLDLDNCINRRSTLSNFFPSKRIGKLFMISYFMGRQLAGDSVELPRGWYSHQNHEITSHQWYSFILYMAFMIQMSSIVMEIIGTKAVGSRNCAISKHWITCKFPNKLPWLC